MTTQHLHYMLTKAVTNDDPKRAYDMIRRYVRDRTDVIHPYNDTSSCFVHPSDPTKVIVHSSFYSGRQASYEWALATENTLLPKCFAIYTGFDEDGDAYSWMIVERLDSATRLKFKNQGQFFSNNAVHSKNIYQHMILNHIREHYVGDKTFVAFLSRLKKQINSRHIIDDNHRKITISFIAKNITWLRDLYKYLMFWHGDVCDSTLNFSEVMARGGDLVLVNYAKRITSTYRQPELSNPWKIDRKFSVALEENAFSLDISTVVYNNDHFDYSVEINTEKLVSCLTPRDFIHVRIED